MRTLIVSQGLERTRTLAAISIHAPNRIIILRNTNDTSPQITKEVAKHVDMLKKTITKKTRGFNPYPFVFDIVEEKMDFFDIVGAYSHISSIIKREREEGNEVFCDISAGNKPIALAMFLACQMHKVPVTYCKAARYLTSKKTRGEHDEIALSAKEPLFFPQLPLCIEPIAIDILNALTIKRFDSISDLVRELGMFPGKAEILSISRKIDKLVELGYVKTKRIGKRKTIEITEQGRQVSRLII
ncbi:MAG: hypothetical protein J7K68_02725 [Candidatus Diapherotrites archaeon]|nr:hypothetical protein [Candidatus Diapherotrites archaeon]